MKAAPRTVLYSAWAPFFSGAERALVVLLENLDPARYRPVVVLGTSGELEHELRTRGIATTVVPVTYLGLRALPVWLSTVGRLAALARREGAVLAHSNDVPSFQPAGYAARLLRIPAITHVRFPDTDAGFRWFLKPGFRQALFVSGALRDDALGAAPSLFGGRSEVIHDGVRIPEEADGGAIVRLRRELGLPEDGVVVALTGQVSEIKGIWDFIDAAAVMVGRGVPVTFAVLGDDLKGKGALREQAQRVVAERGLAERVRFLGFRPDAPRLLAAFDIIAVPSHIEPLGNATLEAMATGRAVVGSRVGGIPEMIVDGETGYLVPPRDPARLADALEVLVYDSSLRDRFGRAGRRRAEASFGVVAHAAAVQKAYDRVLFDRHRG